MSYLEECILAKLEPRVLSIVHKDGGIINDWQLSEALLGVQKHIEDRDEADSHEATNDEVVLCHRVVQKHVIDLSASGNIGGSHISWQGCT